MKKIYLASFYLAITLVCLNITGLFISLRHDKIYLENYNTPQSAKLNESTFHKEIDKIFNNKELSDSSKIVMTTDVVNRGMAHEWKIENKYRYNLTIPIEENYILFSLSFIYPKWFERHEFLNWKKGLERGVGWCSQHAIILSEILNEHGIRSNMINLWGHVVARANIDGTKWIVLDADHGVVLPFDLPYIENNTHVIESYYLDQGYNSEILKWLLEVYKGENNIYENASIYRRDIGKIENISYWLIWIIPIVLCIPHLILILSIRLRVIFNNRIKVDTIKT